MVYLVAIFCSPLALLLTGKPISAVFNLMLYLFSILCWASIIFFHAGFLLWLLAFTHAVLTINNARDDRRARWIADAQRR
ncbi:MAG: hypothetical protein WDM91_04685 [Rhizomicrobium sp.]